MRWSAVRAVVVAGVVGGGGIAVLWAAHRSIVRQSQGDGLGNGLEPLVVFYSMLVVLGLITVPMLLLFWLGKALFWLPGSTARFVFTLDLAWLVLGLFTIDALESEHRPLTWVTGPLICGYLGVAALVCPLDPQEPDQLLPTLDHLTFGPADPPAHQDQTPAPDPAPDPDPDR